MKSLFPRIAPIFTGFVSLSIATIFAQDASIDQLLKKLPPPEKLVKSPVERAMQQRDPAMADPLVREYHHSVSLAEFSAGAAIVARTRAAISEESSGRVRSSALGLPCSRQYGEASGAFRKAIDHPAQVVTSPIFGLGNVEAMQGHFAAAAAGF